MSLRSSFSNTIPYEFEIKKSLRDVKKLREEKYRKIQGDSTIVNIQFFF